MLHFYRSNVRSCPIGPTEQPPNYNFAANAPGGIGMCYNQECKGIKDQKWVQIDVCSLWCSGMLLGEPKHDLVSSNNIYKQ